jgi:cell wall-associated NlpC family hydrolase
MRMHEAAMQYIDVPFRFRGRTDAGLDCIGLVVRSLIDCGVEVDDRINYGREPWNDGLAESLGDHLEKVDRPPQVDDVLLMKMAGRRNPCHVAIVAPYPKGGLALIHCRSDFKKVLMHRMDHKCEEQIMGVFSGKR